MTKGWVSESFRTIIFVLAAAVAAVFVGSIQAAPGRSVWDREFGAPEVIPWTALTDREFSDLQTSSYNMSGACVEKKNSYV